MRFCLLVGRPNCCVPAVFKRALASLRKRPLSGRTGGSSLRLRRIARASPGACLGLALLLLSVAEQTRRQEQPGRRCEIGLPGVRIGGCGVLQRVHLVGCKVCREGIVGCFYKNDLVIGAD